MSHTATNSIKTLRQEIRCKKPHDLADYFGIVYLTKAYYDAMKNNTALPAKPLPSLQELIDANTIVRAYVNAKRFASIKLYRALLKVEDLTAVWLFYNEPTLNIRLGNYQLLAVKHQ